VQQHHYHYQLQKTHLNVFCVRGASPEGHEILIIIGVWRLLYYDPLQVSRSAKDRKRPSHRELQHTSNRDKGVRRFESRIGADRSPQLRCGVFAVGVRCVCSRDILIPWSVSVLRPE